MEKFTLINKDRSRIKVFEPFEDLSNLVLILTQWWFPMVVFIRDQVNQLWREAEWKLSKQPGKNISSY